VYVIEDAAHAFGGRYRGRSLGTIGHFGAFSFHQVKNVTSFGEGGLLVSNLAVAKQFAQCRFLGIDRARQAANWIYDVVGVRALNGSVVQAGNHSSTELQAIGLRCQLARFPQILTRRRAAARYLSNRFTRIPGLIPQPLDTPTCQGTYMLYQLQGDPVALGADIQALKRKLTACGIEQIPHYVPLYEYTVLEQLGYDRAALRASCPMADSGYQHRFTHLPVAGLNQERLKCLADTVIDAVRELKQGH
jgi:dTDP-4-amino-4,6-dideoxygalactose transaminase